MVDTTTKRHAGGRPLKSTDHRDVRVTVQLTADEVARFRVQAEKRGLSVTAYIRQHALLSLRADETTP